MCYYLYGSLYGDIPKEEYNEIQKKYQYRISPGTKHDVKKAVLGTDGYVEDDFRITDRMCDCDSPVGRGDPDDEMIAELRDLIVELSKLPGAKQINICKTWIGRRNKREIRVKLQDLDIASFLADLPTDHFYSIDL